MGFLYLLLWILRSYIQRNEETLKASQPFKHCCVTAITLYLNQLHFWGAKEPTVCSAFVPAHGISVTVHLFESIIDSDTTFHIKYWSVSGPPAHKQKEHCESVQILTRTGLGASTVPNTLHFLSSSSLSCWDTQCPCECFMVVCVLMRREHPAEYWEFSAEAEFSLTVAARVWCLHLVKF